MLLTRLGRENKNMNEIIQNLEVNATNGKENFCYISEKQLKAMKELSKREAKENKQLEQQVKKQKEVIDKAMSKLDIIIYDLDEYDEAPAPSKEELCEIFGILKEVLE